ncbi:Zinc finger BED domain-containing protein, partial [Ooceraea biroi]
NVIENKIHMAIRDNAANMGAGNFTSLGCAAHTLQLVINDSIFKDEEITILIKNCRKILSHFKKSEQANRYLNQFQEPSGLPKHALIQDVETRWNSTYLKMERLFEQKVAINLYMAERGGIDVSTVEE